MQWDISQWQEQENSRCIRPPKRIELMQYDKHQLEEYTNIMQTWFEINSDELEGSSPGEGLMQIMTASVDATYELTKRKRNLQRHVGLRSDFKDGFSPFYYSLQVSISHDINPHQKTWRYSSDCPTKSKRGHVSSRIYC